VIVEVPTPRKINVESTTTATAVLEELYVQVPAELDVGAVSKTKSELQLAVIAGQVEIDGATACAGTI
jgi:hypothetical protein